jgi:hypothetical protein
MPNWLIVMLTAMFFLIGVSAAVFTFKECGWKTLFLGNGGFSAAMMGMCKEN